MGPQHPSTHGVFQMKLRTDGEIIEEIEPVIGYLHRCVEKTAENVSYPGFIPYTDRLDYVAAMNNNLPYVMGLEKLLGIEVPERAEFIRVILCELNRIGSHLVAFGSFGLDMGAFTPILYAFRERERILKLLEFVSGARLTFSHILIGGVGSDVDDDWLRGVTDFCEYFKPKIDDYNNLLSYNKIFLERTVNIGILSREMAIAYGTSGPVLRGSGVEWDLRKKYPYSIYERFDFDIPIGRGEKGTLGDCWDRYIVRIEEMHQSVRIIEQAIKNIPAGDYKTKAPKVVKPKAGEVYSAAENPKGELGFYIVSSGTKTPERVKVRTPSFQNVLVVPEISRGFMIADLVAIFGSIDIVMGEIDR